MVLRQGAFDFRHQRVRRTQLQPLHSNRLRIRSVGKTLVNRTTGLKNANDALKGRIFEVSLADLQKDEDHAFRKVKLRVDEVQGKNCLTNFHGLDFTSDKLRSLVRKWQSLIEANVVVKTTDDYLIRLFCIAFTKRRPNQIRKTTYAASSQIRAIRKKMTEIMSREASSCTLSQLTTKLIPEVIGREIEKAAQGIYPLQNVCFGSQLDWRSAMMVNRWNRSTSGRSSCSSSPSSISVPSSPSTASRLTTSPARRYVNFSEPLKSVKLTNCTGRARVQGAGFGERLNGFGMDGLSRQSGFALYLRHQKGVIV